MRAQVHIGLIGLIALGLTGCEPYNHTDKQFGAILETKNGKAKEPILHLVSEYNSPAIQGRGSCNLSASGKMARGEIKDDNGKMIEEDSMQLIGMETNGFSVLFQLNERVGGTMISNSAICFFPYGMVTRTQLFNSMQVTAKFKE